MPFFRGDAPPFERLEAGLMHHGHEGLGDIRCSVQDVRECLGGDRFGLHRETWDQMRQQSISHSLEDDRSASGLSRET